MFHTIITLAYIIPNIYVFLRIGQLFVNKGYKFYYGLIYIILALVYPYVSLLSAGYSGFVFDTIAIIASYILPFYLYLFLSVLLYDIFLIGNRFFALVTEDMRKSTRFKVTALSSIVFLSMMIVVAGAINFKTIRISEYQIDIPRKSAKIDHLKIAFVADFHLKQETDIRFVERFAKKIDMIRTAADLQMSGHTHNGQLFPLNLIIGNMYQLSWGYQKIVDTHFFVTSGIMLWGPPVRTTGKSEIMVINIRFTGK